jgi:DNA (cytosine-5)-methyltransferase 1
MRPDDADWFAWPEPAPTEATVGSTLLDLMASDGWRGAQKWANKANSIAPTIVGGSKKHGGADLGPTRAKKAWASLGVDAMGVADAPPSKKDRMGLIPKLTCDMVKRIQGWHNDPRYEWNFTGRKTSMYRQIGNAFPPPVAFAVGAQIRAGLLHTGAIRKTSISSDIIHDNVYLALRALDRFATLGEISSHAGEIFDEGTLRRRLEYLARDFVIDEQPTDAGPAYRLRAFKGFVGQEDHERHELFGQLRSKIS